MNKTYIESIAFVLQNAALISIDNGENFARVVSTDPEMMWVPEKDDQDAPEHDCVDIVFSSGGEHSYSFQEILDAHASGKLVVRQYQTVELPSPEVTEETVEEGSVLEMVKDFLDASDSPEISRIAAQIIPELVSVTPLGDYNSRVIATQSVINEIENV